MRMHWGCCFLGIALFLFASCASNQYQAPRRAESPVSPPTEIEPAGGPTATLEPAQATKPHLPSSRPTLHTGLIAGPGPLKEEARVPGRGKNKVVFEFDKADVAEVTNKIFQDYLKLNYVLDPTLQGRLSLYIEGEYSNQELLDIVIKAYAANYISIVPRNGIYYIQPLQRSSSSSLPIADSFMLKKGTGLDRPVIVMYRLRYVDAKQTVNTVRFFLTAGRPIAVDASTNTIIFTEDADNAQTIVSILRALDMNVLKEVGMEVVQLQALSPQEAVASMEALMNKLDIFKDSALKGSVAFLPLEHFGGILVLAQNPEMLSAAKRWLQALDVQGQESNQIHVYFVENGLAADIADILSQVYGEGKSTTGRRQEKRLVGAARTGQTGTGLTGQQQSGLTTSLQGQAQARTGVAGAIATTLSGAVIIVADESNNAIVVRANTADWERIRKSIQSLDIIPRAVLIEVMIAEISLNDTLQYGVEWYLKRKGMNVAGISGRQTIVSSTNPNLTSDQFNVGQETGNVFNAASGLTYFWGSNAGDIGILVNLLSEVSKVRILSNPTLLATDNKEASITVGGREPILTQQATNTASSGTIVNNVQYEDTGIIVTVIPHINSGGLVRMDVEQTTRNVNKTASQTGLNSPSFTERKVKTSLIAQNGNTVVIGGIMQTEQDDANTGVPVLKDIPILSTLFSTKSKVVTRTELIIAITPRVIVRHTEPAAGEFLERLRSLKEKIGGSVNMP